MFITSLNPKPGFNRSINIPALTFWQRKNYSIDKGLPTWCNRKKPLTKIIWIKSIYRNALDQYLKGQIGFVKLHCLTYLFKHYGSMEFKAHWKACQIIYSKKLYTYSEWKASFGPQLRACYKSFHQLASKLWGLKGKLAGKFLHLKLHAKLWK